MLKYPRLNYSYHAEFLDDENVLLMSEKDKTLLSGKLYTLILSEIDKDGISVDDLVKKLKENISVFELFYAIDVLEKKGYITESAPPSFPEETCAYWNSQGLEINRLLAVLQDKSVCLETIGPLRQDVFQQAFNETGIKTGGEEALKVIITDDYEREELRRINAEALKSNTPWMLIKPAGVEIWIGPLFVPGKTGCWECLKQRLTINFPVNTVYKLQRKTERNPPMPAAFIPSSLQAAAGLTAIEIVKWLYFGENEQIEGKIISLDTHSFSKQSHVLTKRPQCSTCGDPETRRPKPVIFKKTSSFYADSAGGYRVIPPEETIASYQHHVSPITGIVPKLVPYHSVKGSPVYNYSSGENMAFMSKSLFWLNNHIRAGNGGKGKTWTQAKAGALCEGVERYGLTYHGDEYHITASLKELGSDAIHPNACMNYSGKQYRDREKFNSHCSKFYFMTPVPFDESLRMDWTPVYSLSEQRFKYLPACFCYAQFPAEDDYRAFAYPDSNGSAAGNTLEEAVLQGLLELVERDSVAIWWYNRLRKPSVDYSSFDDPYFEQLTKYYQSLNRSLYVLDITTDLGIPSFVAVSHRLDDKKRQDIVYGCGTHVNARIAVERALIEINQLLPIANVSEADRKAGKYLTNDKYFLEWLNTATMETEPYLVPSEMLKIRKKTDYSRLCDPNIYDSLMFCLDSIGKNCLETLVLDMTRPDMGLNVVRVIVPGLRHFWKRLAPGRLYDVPVKMGWLDKPLTEEDMNPVGIFI